MPNTACHPQDRFPLLEGIAPLAEHYTHFILDIFGVIHDGIRPFPGTIEALANLKDAGVQTCLLSNSPKRADGAIRQMQAMGIGRELYGHVVTSGEATFAALSERSDEFHASCGRDCWFIGTPGMAEGLKGLDLRYVDGPEDASFILNAIPGTEDSDIAILKAQLQTAAHKNLPMICANPDLVVNIGADQYQCAGTFALYYEELGGRVLYHGKPHAPVYERCLTLLGNPPKDSVLAIGDSLHTDAAGAGAFGIDCAWNIVGIHQEELRCERTGAPVDAAKIEAAFARYPHKPRYILNGFGW